MSDIFNALQSIIIRERLILYFEHQTAKQGAYSVRALNEAVTFSLANEGQNSGYSEDEDQGDRYDSGLPVKNNTLENFLKRKSSSTKDDNLTLICNYLLTKGFVSPRLVSNASNHPDENIKVEFAGIAATDPRLQKYRYGIEGEYFNAEDTEISHIWIAQQGRSKPFVTLRNTAERPKQNSENPLPSLKTLNYDVHVPQSVFEGRIFLMPGDTLMHVEVSHSNKKWIGNLHHLSMRNNQLFLHNESQTGKLYERPSPENCSLLQRNTYRAMQFATTSDFVKGHSPERGVFGIFSQSNSEEKLENTQRKFSEEQLKLNNAMLEAVKDGKSADVISALIAGADINSKDSAYGRTAIHWAAALNDLTTVLVLSGTTEDENSLHSVIFPDTTPSQADLDKWRNAKATLNHTIVDEREECFASAFAPVGGDHSERNDCAKKIMMHLLALEGRAMANSKENGKMAVITAWKPSSVMEKAHEDYPVHPPQGFGLPPVEPE